MSKIEEAKDKIAELTDKIERRDKHIMILEELRDVLTQERDELKEYRDAISKKGRVEWEKLHIAQCNQCGFPQGNQEFQKLEQQLSAEKQKNEELEEDNEQLENDLRNMANLVGSQSNQIEQLTQERDVEHGLVKMRSEENTSLTTELIKLTKQLSAEKQKNKNLIENGYYDDQPIKGSVDYLLMAEELKAEKQKNEELKKGVEEISNQNKYKQVGDRDSYSSYNEGWQDCIDSVEQLLNK
jgi:DNA repair exonuclease SbcCD ATPase subunit